MTDIIDLFLDVVNIEHMSRILDVPQNFPIRARMHEFIYGPYAGGLYDVWNGTDADLYVREMNNEFIKYMQLRYGARTRDVRASARLEIAAQMDPFERAREREMRGAMAQPRRQLKTYSGASTDGAPLRLANADTDARYIDRKYAQWNRNQSSAVHLSARDDEGGDVGHRSLLPYLAASANDASLPYGRESINGIIEDPCAGSGDAQYHLFVLDSQMSVLNEERTIPFGYGSAQEQLADDARIAARYEWRRGREDAGVIPKTNFKKLTHAIDPMGRVTLDDDYKLATDIMSRDSKGFILSGR